MQIKFVAPDPRAGDIAQMDSSLGQQFIDSESAVLVRDGGSEAAPAPTVAAPAKAVRAPDNKAARPSKNK